MLRPVNNLHIRPIRSEDAASLNRYWESNTADDLERMGELNRPDLKMTQAFIEAFCASPLDPRTTEEDIRIWCVDESPIGYSTLKSIRFGDEAQIHLHVWDKTQRRKGFSSFLFCQTALAFIEAFELKRLYCQPHVGNPMPHGMLRKIGFPELPRVRFDRADGSSIWQSRFHIKPGVAEDYIEHANL